MTTPERRVLCLATQGTGSLDEDRIRSLLFALQPALFPFDRSAKFRTMLRLLAFVWQERPDLVVMEGTGIAGGVPLILSRLRGVRYVISSGDAVGPHVAQRHPMLGPLGRVYERLLMRCSTGFIGWTPYLVGRALTLGAPSAVSAPAWARKPPDPDARSRWRARFGIEPDSIVFGLLGSLIWTQSVGYVYGLDLVRAIRKTRRADVCVCIVGTGSGVDVLKREASDELGRRVLIPGPVAPDEASDVVAAFDVANLPQSVNQVGSFRYTTKLADYIAAGLPVVTGRIPVAYDLGRGWMWRLPGKAPWDEMYVQALSELIETLSREELAERTSAARQNAPIFDEQTQRERVCAYVEDLLESKA